MTLFGKIIVNIISIAALLYSFNIVAADDEYLKMLEGEAQELELDKSGQLKQQADKADAEDYASKNWDYDGNTFPSGLAQEEFVSFLKQNFYGSYAFFSKLNSIDQQTVYYHYKKASPAHLDDIRQDIMGLLKN